MKATVADLQRGAPEMIRSAMQRGEEIVLTDSGEPVAKIIPFMRTVTVSPDEARASGRLSDQAILAAIRESRDEAFDRSEQPNCMFGGGRNPFGVFSFLI